MHSISLFQGPFNDNGLKTFLLLFGKNGEVVKNIENQLLNTESKNSIQII